MDKTLVEISRMQCTRVEQMCPVELFCPIPLTINKLYISFNTQDNSNLSLPHVS